MTKPKLNPTQNQKKQKNNNNLSSTYSLHKTPKNPKNKIALVLDSTLQTAYDALQQMLQRTKRSMMLKTS